MQPPLALAHPGIPLSLNASPPCGTSGNHEERAAGSLVPIPMALGSAKGSPELRFRGGALFPRSGEGDPTTALSLHPPLVAGFGRSLNNWVGCANPKTALPFLFQGVAMKVIWVPPPSPNRTGKKERKKNDRKIYIDSCSTQSLTKGKSPSINQCMSECMGAYDSPNVL